MLRQHPRASLIVAGCAIFALLGSGAVAIGAAVGNSDAARFPVAAPTPTRSTPPRPVPSAEPAAIPMRTCSVAELATDDRLGSLQAQVRNAATGEILFDRGGGTPNRAAGVTQVLTAAAALKALGRDYRVPTTVVKGAEPGTVVLVGGGDVTLSRLDSADDSIYPGSAHLDDLADRVEKAWQADPSTNGQPITNLVLDSSLFAAPFWQPSWDERQERVVEGSTPYITALMVDGDRADPTETDSRRSTDPVARAGEAFADELDGDITVSQGTAPAGAVQLGQVLSQPVAALAQQAISTSDNAIMEMLARLVAIKTGAGNTFAAENQGVVSVLHKYGIDTTGIQIADGSGLSNDNAVPPTYLTQLFAKILARQDGLGAIYDALPISGNTGTLAFNERFTGDNAVADGAVHAKTGRIDGGYTLAGIIDSEDGTPLTFAIYALGDVSDNAKRAIDTLTTGFFHCGNNLSNN